MFRPTGRLVILAVGLALLAVGCGEEIEVASTDPVRDGAVLFRERCSGCHTLDAAGSGGSMPEGEIESGDRTNGPNFNQRAISADDALYAIRNGGFSGAIMPANIVVGEEADIVAEFLAEYAGQDAGQEGEASGSGETGG